VVAPKTDRALKSTQFVPLGPGRALVVLVTEDGLVEKPGHRGAARPAALLASSPPGNFLNAASSAAPSRGEARGSAEIEAQKTQLDELDDALVERA